MPTPRTANTPALPAMLHLTKFDTRAYGRDAEGNVPTAPVTINRESIRCFYPRRNEQPGTRITFTDGGGFPVAESYDDVKRYVETGERPATPVQQITHVSHDDDEGGEDGERALRDEDE